MTINLGDKAKDSVSGFSGIVTGYFTYMNGCVRIQIEPDRLDKDEKPIDSMVFDIQQCEPIETAKHRVTAPSGGPRSDPSPRSNPSR